MNKTIKIKVQNIKLWERKGFFQTIHLHWEKKKFEKSETFLIKILMILEDKKKLPQAQKTKIFKAMEKSHRNMSQAFRMRYDNADVLDIDDVIYQLI